MFTACKFVSAGRFSFHFILLILSQMGHIINYKYLSVLFVEEDKARGCELGVEERSNCSSPHVWLERSFSQYKSLLRDNRRLFKFENLKQYFVAYCYGSRNNQKNKLNKHITNN